MKKPVQKAATTNAPERKSRGRKREDASFPVATPPMGLPDSYAAVLDEIKRRIQAERLRTVMAANSAMIMFCPQRLPVKSRCANVMTYKEVSNARHERDN